MIRKTTVIVASGDADTQMRRIRKSAEHCAEHPAERRITERNPYERYNEHYNSGTNRSSLLFYEVKGTGNLSRIQARIIEQRLINAYGMEKYGGALFNKRNEIGHQYWIRYGIINN